MVAGREHERRRLAEELRRAVSARAESSRGGRAGAAPQCAGPRPAATPGSRSRGSRCRRAAGATAARGRRAAQPAAARLQGRARPGGRQRATAVGRPGPRDGCDAARAPVAPRASADPAALAEPAHSPRTHSRRGGPTRPPRRRTTPARSREVVGRADVRRHRVDEVAERPQPHALARRRRRSPPTDVDRVVELRRRRPRRATRTSATPGSARPRLEPGAQAGLDPRARRRASRRSASRSRLAQRDRAGERVAHERRAVHQHAGLARRRGRAPPRAVQSAAASVR